jgi:hypothetical protein
MSCCREVNPLSPGECGLCPGQITPQRWEVVVPSMSRHPDHATQDEVLFRDDGCPGLCYSEKLIGAKVLDKLVQTVDACSWLYVDEWQPVCDDYSGGSHLEYRIDLTLTDIGSGQKKWRATFGSCNPSGGVCIPPSYLFAAYELTVTASDRLSNCRSVTLDLCESTDCNFFFDEKTCVWPSTMTFEAIA